MARKKKFSMKMGFRTPSPKKSFKARTTGKLKRRMKKLVNPFYGKKGVGYIKNPRRAIRNKIYRKTTFGVRDFLKLFSLKLYRKKRKKRR